MTNNNITEEMIEAGGQELCNWEPGQRMADLAVRVYTAMQAASQPPVTMDGLVERLSVMADDIHLNIEYAGKEAVEAEIGKARDAITTLLATIERQREALRPFAERIDALEAVCRRLDCGVQKETNVEVADLRRARKALESQP